MNAALAVDRDLGFRQGGRALSGRLRVPDQARGLVLFAHGSGSSRLSPRNRLVATRLETERLGTYLFDLLTEDEAGDRALVFDIPMLAGRLRAATDAVVAMRDPGALPFGYFGASTGAGAALVAAADRDDVAAVVSRGGRPDLAGDALARVRAPTLLIVGGHDLAVLQLNEEALDLLPGEKELVVVPGATHLFEEPGAIEQVADLAADWFARHLRPA